jgi:hypothetical protein
MNEVNPNLHLVGLRPIPPGINAIQSFIEEAKERFDLHGTNWEDADWDITGWGKNRRRRHFLHFRAHDGVPFEPIFANLVKAVLSYLADVNRLAPTTLSSWLMAFKFLYQATHGTAADGTSTPIWAHLTLRDWHRAEALVAMHDYAPATKYNLAKTLQAIATFLHGRGFIPRTGYQHQQLGQRSSNIRHIEDRDARQHLPAPTGALLALADASQAPKDDQDSYCFAIIKLFMVFGFRMNEALTLPADTWHEDEDGQPYLAYWPEKGGPLERKVIPKAAIPLIRTAIDTLTTLGAGARARARELEATPGRIPLLVKHDPSAILDSVALTPAFGLSAPGAAREFLMRRKIPPIDVGTGTKGDGARWRVDDIERGLAHQYDIQFLALRLPNGKVQKLSQFLCIVPHRFFRRQPSLFFVNAVGQVTIAKFLYSSPSEGRSVFQRYKLLDDCGQPWSLHSHQFRHWIDNLLANGGLSDLERARWMGRRDIRQNDAYEHPIKEQRIERLKGGIRAGEAEGSVTQIYHSLPPVSRERFLDAAVAAAHATPFGICLHDFATKPCEFHVQCLSGCGDFVRTKGDQGQIRNILQVKTKAEAVLEAAQRAAEEGFAYAPNWVHQQQRLLAGADRALAIEDSADIPNGDNVAVFPGAPGIAGLDTRHMPLRHEQEITNER